MGDLKTLQENQREVCSSMKSSGGPGILPLSPWFPSQVGLNSRWLRLCPDPMSFLGAIVDCRTRMVGWARTRWNMKGQGNRPVLEMTYILPALWVKDHLQMPHRTQGYSGPNGIEDVLAVCRVFTTQAERPVPLPQPQHRSQECQPTAGPRLYPPDPPPLPLGNSLVSSLYPKHSGFSANVCKTPALVRTRL